MKRQPNTQIDQHHPNGELVSRFTQGYADAVSIRWFCASAPVRFRRSQTVPDLSPHYRVPPHNEAEQALLGAILIAMKLL